jgi:hypothetical protein
MSEPLHVLGGGLRLQRVERSQSDTFIHGDERVPEKTFAAFMEAVKDSVEGHARRKNYTTGGADDENQLLKVAQILGIHDQHCVGEIIYKCAEYLKAPAETKKILLLKVAGWAFILWRSL